MEQHGFTDDPVYRAGMMLGRQQSVVEILQVLRRPDGGSQINYDGLLEWCVQTQFEADAELTIVLANLRNGK